MVYAIEPQINSEAIRGIWDEEVERFTNVKCIKNSKEFGHSFVCFNYALGVLDINSCECAMDIVEDEYTRIRICHAKVGDLITYHSDFECKGKKQIDRYSINHFALITKTNGKKNGTFVRSKWGLDGLFEGKVDEIPEIYGELICVWRKK